MSQFAISNCYHPDYQQHWMSQFVDTNKIGNKEELSKKKRFATKKVPNWDFLDYIMYYLFHRGNTLVQVFPLIRVQKNMPYTPLAKVSSHEV